MSDIPTHGAPPNWQLLQWLLDPARLLEGAQSRFGDVFRLRIGGWANLVVVAEPTLIREVLVDEPGRTETGRANEMMTALVGEWSIFVIDGGAHRSLRRSLSELFTVSGRAELERDLEAQLEAQLLSSRDAKPSAELVLRRASCRVAWRLICGRDVPAASRLAEPLARAVGPRAAAVAFGGTMLKRLALGPLQRALGEIDRAIEEEFRGQASGRLPRGGLFGLMLESGNADDPALVQCARDNAISILAAGADTTASAGAWMTALALTERHPLAARIAAACAENDDRYLEALALESLRLGPVVEVVSRRAAHDFDLGGYQVRTGDLVSACPYLLHRDARVFPDPLRFDPDRFLLSPPPPHEFIPFGGGARRCLGAGVALAILKTWARVIARSDLAGLQIADLRPRRRNVTLGPSGGGRLFSPRWSPASVVT